MSRLAQERLINNLRECESVLESTLEDDIAALQALVAAAQAAVNAARIRKAQASIALAQAQERSTLANREALDAEVDLQRLIENGGRLSTWGPWSKNNLNNKYSQQGKFGPYPKWHRFRSYDEGSKDEYFVESDSGDLSYLDEVNPSSLTGYNENNQMTVFVGRDDSGNYYLFNNTHPDTSSIQGFTDGYYYGNTQPTVLPMASFVFDTLDVDRVNTATRELDDGGIRLYGAFTPAQSLGQHR